MSKSECENYTYVTPCDNLKINCYGHVIIGEYGYNQRIFFRFEDFLYERRTNKVVEFLFFSKDPSLKYKIPIINISLDMDDPRFPGLDKLANVIRTKIRNYIEKNSDKTNCPKHYTIKVGK